jgi:MSHA biogenesis protein MshO
MEALRATNKNVFKKSARGFTLIEIIVVIVVLSILAVLGGKFITESTASYQTTQARSRLVNTSRQAMERMSRQLRAALPNSVRLTNGGSCIEFLPIAAAGNYVNKVPDAVNAAPPSASIQVSPHTIDFGNALFVSIGATQASELYGDVAVSRANLSARTNILLTLTAPTRWQRNSINKRFYLLDAPQAFCVVGSELRFYAGQDVTNANVNTASSSNSSLLAENVTAPVPFSLGAGSENRNTIVQFNLTFNVPIRVRIGANISTGPEALAFNHLVMIRNVP